MNKLRSWLDQFLKFNLSPDSIIYLRAADGQSVQSPFHRRWLVPAIVGSLGRKFGLETGIKSWLALTYLSLGLTSSLAFAYFGEIGHLSSYQRLYAATLLALLPGVWRCSLRFPVLLDAFSFALALLTAAVAVHHPWFAIPLALVLGATRETGPIFAALWSWSPWPLLGLLAVGWWKKAGPAVAGEESLWKVFLKTWHERRMIGADASLYLVPFGAALAGLFEPSWQLALTIVAAFGQLLVATDTIRLTIWCAPVLVLQAAHVTPLMWMPGCLLLSLFLKDSKGRV